jgi:hypothetical protein
MTAKHFLQECPSYNKERTETWEQAVTPQDKLNGDAENFELTTNFCKRINANHCLSSNPQTKKNKKKQQPTNHSSNEHLNHTHQQITQIDKSLLTHKLTKHFNHTTRYNTPTTQIYKTLQRKSANYFN